EGGEQLRADVIVATVSARPLGEILDAGALPERVMSRLRGWRYGIGTLKVDFALSGSVPWRAEEARRAAVVHLGGELAEMFDAFHQADIGTVPAALPLVVGQQSLFDRTRAPQSGETLYAYARIVSDPGASGEGAARALLGDLARRRPWRRGRVATSLYKRG